ncbi:hypothetical protein [Sphingomonas sp. MMS24-J13]|uniref:hypothetical protein n=1 Tax=Sphingomonas sp. MMS24-J13 TaxID=3238686 RepID=UPI00384C3F3F
MRWAVILVMLAGPAVAADVAGPALPAKTVATPAQAAMARYRSNYAPAAPPKPCQRPEEGEVVVCAADGRGGSADRLPLPDELGRRDEARLAKGEPPHLGVGGSPVKNPPGTGLTLTLKGGKTTITGNSDR